MSLFNNKETRTELKNNRKPIWKVVFVLLGLLLLIGIVFFWKVGNVFNKVSTGGGFFQNIVGALPGVNDELKGETEDRVNVLVLGMRGENIPGGGLLADTIIVASIKPKENKISMISIPRDLYVDNPSLAAKSKINAVYAYGEQKAKGQGLADMRQVVGDITGLEIPYGGVINFKGFSDIVDALGGVDIELSEPFSEPLQFNKEKVCDDYVFTVPTGKYETKWRTKSGGEKYIAAQYPLCTNPDLECDGIFKLPSGKQTLNGEDALCYVRSRETSSDFERAKRQQEIITKIKQKALSLGTLTDFGKISDLMDSLGNNVQTDMQLWEMKRFFELYREMVEPKTFQKVLETSEGGLLYFPPKDLYEGAGSIILPIGDNYDKIREMARDIFIQQ